MIVYIYPAVHWGSGRPHIQEHEVFAGRAGVLGAPASKRRITCARRDDVVSDGETSVEKSTLMYFVFIPRS